MVFSVMLLSWLEKNGLWGGMLHTKQDNFLSRDYFNLTLHIITEHLFFVFNLQAFVMAVVKKT